MRIQFTKMPEDFPKDNFDALLGREFRDRCFHSYCIKRLVLEIRPKIHWVKADTLDKWFIESNVPHFWERTDALVGEVEKSLVHTWTARRDRLPLREQYRPFGGVWFVSVHHIDRIFPTPNEQPYEVGFVLLLPKT
jgi:hypothetical protein